MRTLTRLFILIFFAAILFLGWLYYHVHKDIQLPVTPYEFTVESGSSLRNITQQLANAEILSNTWSFILLSRFMGNESLLKAGDYTLTENLSPIELLEYLIKGDVKQNEIKFIEGWTFSQLRNVLNEHPAIRHDTINLSDQEILRLIGANETAAEGLFFPDTYYFLRNSSDVEILQRAYLAMQRNLQVVWITRNEPSPLNNTYEALILASIIEKETGLDRDRAEIAGVFINRLRIGMRMQTDPTVIYGMGDTFDGNLRKKDLSTDHSHNTYTRLGLPPTPIALPGLASIQAALNPAETKAIYFVAKGNGKSQFSTNLADHNRAVAKYQKRQKQ
ncbi:MAG: endolytic transglycosylase MltG [Nitrosomonas sp.]|nr:endolytic transglycosylase MltG [Nitrosomonas sp.]MDP1950390.1 endolytic transglycosylase MltG [Nitrosomonas sp.]